MYLEYDQIHHGGYLATNVREFNGNGRYQATLFIARPDGKEVGRVDRFIGKKYIDLDEGGQVFLPAYSRVKFISREELAEIARNVKEIRGSDEG